jgi:DNA-binding transcriptional ArsR family regulator
VAAFAKVTACQGSQKTENAERRVSVARREAGDTRSAKLLFALCQRLVYLFNQMVKYPSRMLNRTFAALADPTRRRILAHLARGDKCVTHLARPHAMSLPAVSKHLRVLEKAGLLRRRRYGRVHEMQLEAKPLKQAAQWVEEYRKFWEGSLDRLAEYLEKTHKRTGKKGKN